jgi:hypothetical protein
MIRPKPSPAIASDPCEAARRQKCHARETRGEEHGPGGDGRAAGSRGDRRGEQRGERDDADGCPGAERRQAPDVDQQHDREEEQADERRRHEREGDAAEPRAGRRLARPRAPAAEPDERHGAERGDRRLRVEDRPPAEPLGERAAERRAEGGAEDARARPERRASPRRERPHHRQRPDEQPRGGDALNRAEGDQHPDVGRDGTHERRDREDDAAGEREACGVAAPAEEGERERAEGERDVVRRDDPRHAVDRDVVLREQVGQREDDDRRVRERDRDRCDERREPERHYAMWISTSSATPPRIV